MTEKDVKIFFDVIDKAVDDVLSIASDVGKTISKPEYKPLYAPNLLEYFGAKEVNMSWAIREILNYEGENKDYPIMRLFIRSFLPEDEINEHWVRNPVIQCETDHIDVSIYDEKYIIVIENKLYGACFQRNQLARYLHIVGEKSRGRKVFLVIMPLDDDDSYKTNIQKSVWRLPQDWYMPNGERECAVGGDSTLCRCDMDSYKADRCCAECLDYKSQWIDKAICIGQELPVWLDSLVPVIPPKEVILSSFILQFSYYLKILFNQTTNKKLNMEIKSILKEKIFREGDTLDVKLRKIEEQTTNLNEVLSQISAIRKELILDGAFDEAIKYIADKPTIIKRDFKDGPFRGFKTTDGILVGLAHDDTGLFISFRTDNGKELNDDQLQVVNKMKEDNSLYWNGNSHSHYFWHYTNSPTEDFISFYRTILSCGFKFYKS